MKKILIFTLIVSMLITIVLPFASFADGEVIEIDSAADLAAIGDNLSGNYKLTADIEATAGTAAFLKSNGIRTVAMKKISEGSDEIPNALRQGHIAYFINTKDLDAKAENDGVELRQVATEYNVTMFTSLDTVDTLLDVLEETTLTISTIDA